MLPTLQGTFHMVKLALTTPTLLCAMQNYNSPPVSCRVMDLHGSKTIRHFLAVYKTHSRKAKWSNLCISKMHKNYTYLILQNIVWLFFLYKENYTNHKLRSTIPMLQSLTTLKWGCAAIINITLLRLCYYVLRRGRVGQSCGCSAWWPLWCGRAGWHCSEPPRHTLLRSAVEREKKHTGCIITKSKTQWETGRLTHKHSQRRPSRHDTHNTFLKMVELRTGWRAGRLLKPSPPQSCKCFVSACALCTFSREVLLIYRQLTGNVS